MNGREIRCPICAARLAAACAIWANYGQLPAGEGLNKRKSSFFDFFAHFFRPAPGKQGKGGGSLKSPPPKKKNPPSISPSPPAAGTKVSVAPLGFFFLFFNFFLIFIFFLMATLRLFNAGGAGRGSVLGF